MTRAYHLFVRRLQFDLGFQYCIFRTAVYDWIVVAYFVIPALFYFIRYYFFLWSNKPEWIYDVPVICFALCFFMLTGFMTIRSFYDYADQLFLLQRKSWITAISKYAILYSYVINGLITSFLLLCWLPILYYGFNMLLEQIIVFFLFHVFFTTPFSMMKRRIGVKINTIQQVIGYFILYVVGCIIYVVVVTIEYPYIIETSTVCLGLLNLYFLFTRKNDYKKNFLEYVAYDSRNRIKISTLLLNTTGYKFQSSGARRSAPIWFRNSRQLFKNRESSNILAENCVKSFFRDFKYVRHYLQLIVFSCIGIYPLPDIVSYFFLVLLALAHFSISKKVWLQFIGSDFLKLYSWSLDVKKKAIRKVMIALTIPGYSLVVLIFIIKLHSLLSIIVCVLSSTSIFYLSFLFSYKGLSFIGKHSCMWLMHKPSMKIAYVYYLFKNPILLKSMTLNTLRFMVVYLERKTVANKLCEQTYAGSECPVQ